MTKKFIMIAMLGMTLAFASCGGGSTPTTCEPKGEFTWVFEGNPLIRHMYTADPSARVWADGRLYVYPSQDKKPAFGCDMMDEYHVFSTDDMINWVDHGMIVAARDVPWGVPIMMGDREATFMWAPDCIYKDGKYYFYFPHPYGPTWNDTWRIGVAVSDEPAANFTVLPEPVKGTEVSWTKNDGTIGSAPALIDPNVFLDDDGTVYFYIGGGVDGTGRYFGGKLKDNMIEMDGELQAMEGLEDFHEAIWVFKRNGIYYLTYSDNYELETPEGRLPRNRMRYAMSSNPLGPWEYKGIYMDVTNSHTNHGSVVEFKGQWYAFYHNSDLSLYNGEFNDWFRSVAFDKLYFNEDGTIQMVEQTRGLIKE